MKIQNIVVLKYINTYCIVITIINLITFNFYNFFIRKDLISTQLVNYFKTFIQFYVFHKSKIWVSS